MNKTGHNYRDIVAARELLTSGALLDVVTKTLGDEGASS